MASRSKELYVIKEAKDKGDCFIFLHSDKKDISPEATNLEGAMKFTKEEVNFIYDNFKYVWNRDSYEVHKIEMTMVRNYNWHS